MSRNTKLLLFFCLIIMTYIPMIWIDYYRDDLFRSTSGLYGWSHLGRPMAELLASLLSGCTGILLDSSPIPQLVAIAFLCLTFYFLSVELTSRYNTNEMTSSVASLVLVCSPFLLQNMAYKYDSSGMFLALFLSTISAIVGFRKRGALSSIALMLLSLCIYQPATNVFLGVTSILLTASIYRQNKKPLSALKSASVNIALYMLSMLIYKALFNIMSSEERSSTLPLNMMYNGVMHNIILFTDIIKSIDFPLLYIAVSALIFISVVYTLSNKIMPGEVFVLFISISISTLSIAGPLLILKDANNFPRVMMSSMSILSCLIVYVNNGFFRKITTYISIAFVFGVLSLSCIISNSIKNQDEYENMILTSINAVLAMDGVVNSKFIFDGAMPVNKRTSIAMNSIPYLKYIIQPSSRWMIIEKFRNMGNANLSYNIIGSLSNEERNNICAKAPNRIAEHFTLFYSKSYTLVSFNKLKYIDC
ncbi:glucosyltransferase domain-containing protein [Escherichia coli]|nr:glucosyltransferase domain-containing protein [Escherichia coli]